MADEAPEKAFEPDRFCPLVLCGPDGNVVGELELIGDQLVFSGNADEAAKVFFENVIKQWADYVK